MTISQISQECTLYHNLDAYTRLLGLPSNVWIHNDGSKVYLCQVL